MKKLNPVRQGIVHVGVLIVCVVLAIGAFAFHYAMRQGRASAYHTLHGEHAAMLARAGLSLAQVHLDRVFADLASPARRGLVAPLAALAAGQVKLGTVDLAAAFPEMMRELSRDLPHGLAGISGLEATFGVSTARALPAVTLADRTLPRGEREKCGELFIECTARVSTGGPFGEVSRTVRALHQFRVVAAPVPLLSDFTVFLEDRPVSGGWGKPNPLAKLSIKNGDWGSDLTAKPELSLESARSRGMVFLGDNERTKGRSDRGYRPQLPRDLLPGPWADVLDRFEPGNLVLADLAPQFAQVACWNVPDGRAVTAFLEARGLLSGARLDLGTSVRGGGALTLPALDAVRRGGVLIAGQITITGAIPRSERGALVLIATDGPIRVPAGVPVHASLIALKGPVIFDGAPEVHGNVAAVRLDTAGLAEGARVVYDQRLKERAFGDGATESLLIDFARKPSLVD